MQNYFFSQKQRDELIASYYAKAERDYDEAIELKAMVFKGRPRKKYQTPTASSRRAWATSSLDLIYRKESIDRATQKRITDREGYFVLACSKIMLLGNMLRTYRLKSRTEDVFRDFKHGIDIRPLGCSDENFLGDMCRSCISR